jgi:hypothetical protein
LRAIFTNVAGKGVSNEFSELQRKKEGVMSQITEEGPLREVAILTRAVETVFRKLIRLLVGRMSLTKLQEMIRIIFIEEAEAKLQSEGVSKSISLSRLGVLTGLDTRTLKKLRQQLSKSSGLSCDEYFLEGFTPLFRVFDVWMNDKRFFDFKNMQPKVLKIEEGKNSFSALIKIAMPMRGITVSSILQRLKDSGVVIQNKTNNEVELINKDNIFITRDELDMIEMGLDATSHLLETIANNIEHRKESESKFFQRGFWNYQINLEEISKTREALHYFLKETDKKGRDLLSSLEEPEITESQITVGVGMFYFEANPKDRPKLKPS